MFLFSKILIAILIIPLKTCKYSCQDFCNRKNSRGKILLQGCDKIAAKVKFLKKGAWHECLFDRKNVKELRGGQGNSTRHSALITTWCLNTGHRRGSLNCSLFKQFPSICGSHQSSACLFSSLLHGPSPGLPESATGWQPSLQRLNIALTITVLKQNLTCKILNKK